MVTLRDKYQKDVAPALRKERGYLNPMQVPRLVKIVVNMGINSSVDRDTFKAIVEDLATITGQRPQIRNAKKSISNFKLRADMPIGARVTLRGARMYEFLERLIHATLPRIRDFRGVPTHAFDGRGNYTLGLTEQTIFPEIVPDRVKKTQGMDITIVTTAPTNEEAQALLKKLGMPFAAEKSR
jgi:large subunit ribosomal protein L5